MHWTPSHTKDACVHHRRSDIALGSGLWHMRLLVVLWALQQVIMSDLVADTVLLAVQTGNRE